MSVRRPALPTLLAGALVLASALACTGEAANTVEEPSTVLLQADDVVVVSKRPIATGPRLSGSLEPAAKAVLRAETNGSVKDVGVEIGDTVREGQLLARIDNSAAGSGFQSARSSVTSAEQDVLIAERELERVDKLVAAGALSARDRELAQSGLVQAKARLAAAKAQLAMQGEAVDATTVKSPIAGVVAQRNVSDGDVVAMGSPLFTVIEPSSLRLEASVPASAVGLLHLEAPVFFEIQGYDRSFEGHIERIAPAVDPVSRQIPVLVSVPNQGGELLAGLFAEGRVAVERRDGIVVPADAIDDAGPRPAVHRIVSGKVERAEVRLGLADEQADTVEIVSGVEEGDTLLLGSVRDVPDGAEVEIGDAAKEG
ncbi:MAG: efflux RND transporter periplasmic adaptor subunit [Alphaproteobacteria bacterium]|nr:efflux RND transporter periplasmic adaptor subunit [Alphaproteobacteria bacterium]MCB9697213.1 efflux RND transporter periplasmic adaptor subunit [Alphaproteobacteria bacterium]